MTKWYVHHASSSSNATEVQAHHDHPGGLNSSALSTVPDASSIRGPFRPSELLGLVRDGTIVPETMLRKDDSAWFPAISVGGLFEAAVQPTITYVCPDCGVKVPQPPCVCPRCLRELQFLKPIIETHRLPEKQNQAQDEAVESRNRWLSRLKRRNRK